MTAPTQPATPVLPSDDFQILERQLTSALDRLAGGGEGQAKTCRSYLHYAVALVWRQVARGELGAPDAWLEHLDHTRGFMRRHLPKSLSAQEWMACDLLGVMRVFEVASRALEELLSEQRLANRERSATEREVLRVLLAAEKPLRRGEVNERLREDLQRSGARIGQILSELHEEGLLVRLPRPARGGREVGFFELAAHGKKICQRLGLDQEEPHLFDFSHELQERCLVPERIAPASEDGEPGRITTFWAYRGGIGRTTAVAHAAWTLARKLPEEERVLAVDLDLKAPRLDSLFQSTSSRDCRGLRGLVVDFYRQPEGQRASWLREQLTSERYVFRPFPEDCPNLYVLPSGFTLGGDRETEKERSEALRLLESEAGITKQGERSGPRATRGNFVAGLAAGIGEVYRKTLVDSASGFSLGAWIACCGIADQLALFTRGEEDREGNRVLLANFLRRSVSSASGPGGVVIIPALGAEEDAIGKEMMHLLPAPFAEDRLPSLLGFWRNFECFPWQAGRDGEASEVDRKLSRLLLGASMVVSTRRPEIDFLIRENARLRKLFETPAVRQAIETLLDEDYEWYNRRLCAGLLASPAMEGILPLIENLLRERAISSESRSLLQAISAAHADENLKKLVEAAFSDTPENDIRSEVVRVVENVFHPKEIDSFRIRGLKVVGEENKKLISWKRKGILFAARCAQEIKGGVYSRRNMQDGSYNLALYNGFEADWVLSLDAPAPTRPRFSGKIIAQLIGGVYHAAGRSGQLSADGAWESI